MTIIIDIMPISTPLHNELESVMSKKHSTIFKTQIANTKPHIHTKNSMTVTC